MKKLYKVDLRHQLRSGRKMMYYIALSFVVLGLIFLIDQGSLSWWVMFLIGTSAFWFTFLLILPFHIQYLMANWNTKLLIDDEIRTATIQNKAGEFTYKFEELRIERYIVSEYKDAQFNAKPIPFQYYGYVKIKTKDNKMFYITSLMIDPFDFPLLVNSTKFGLPFIKGEVS